MKYIVSISLSIILSFFSQDAAALVSVSAPQKVKLNQTTISKAQLETQLGRKLKFKEKFALWILKKKLRKLVKKQQTTPFPINPIDTSYCANILLNNGETIQATLLKISDTSVKFIICGTKKVITLSKSDLLSISLYDGITLYAQPDVISQKEKIAKSIQRSKKLQHLGPLSLLSTILAIVTGFVHPAFFFFFIILAISSGLTGSVNTNQPIQQLAFLGMILSTLVVFLVFSGLLFKNFFH